MQTRDNAPNLRGLGKKFLSAQELAIGIKQVDTQVYALTSPWGLTIRTRGVAILETDADQARRAARAIVVFYLGLRNDQRSLGSIGFDESDFAKGGSDRLIDAMIRLGDQKTLRERIAAHYRTRATQVCVTLVRRKPLPRTARCGLTIAPRGARAALKPPVSAREGHFLLASAWSEVAIVRGQRSVL